MRGSSPSSRPVSFLIAFALIVAAIAPLVPVQIPLVMAQGDPCVVTTGANDDEGSLREALAADCALITFASGVTDVVLTTSLDPINKQVEIRGQGIGDVTVRRNTTVNDFRIFTILAGGNVILNGLTISHGRAVGASNDPLGGAILVDGATLTIIRSTLEHNYAETNGGAINIINAAQVEIIESTIRHNNADLSGGGILNAGTSLTVTSSTIYANHAAAGGGGAIWNSGSLITSNSTIQGNTSGNSGGGVYSSEASLTIRASTIAGNSAAQGDAVFVNAGSVTMEGSIVTGPTPGAVCNIATITGSFNLTNGTGCFGAGNGNLHDADPQLGPLGNNGGPTQTMLPAATSPALNKIPTSETALCSGSDQRSVGRPQGTHCDIGAVERSIYDQNPNNPIVVTSTADPTPTNEALITLRQAIAAAPSGESIAFNITDTDGSDRNIVDGNFVIQLTSGQLTIDKNLTIQGPNLDLTPIEVRGRTVLTVPGNVPDSSSFRVFEVADGVEATLDGLVISDGGIGGQDGQGGGIYNGGILAVANSTITRNHVTGVGGGIFNNGELTVINSTLLANTAVQRGGSISTTNHALATGIETTIINSTITQGSAQTSGAINAERGKLVITSSTIAGNGGAVGLFVDAGNVDATLQASIVTDSCGANSFGSGSYNVVTFLNCSSGPGTNTEVGYDPMLSELGDHGGPTQTFMLLPGSRAIAHVFAGTCLTLEEFDQRGVERQANPGHLCDAGAVASGLAPGLPIVVRNTNNDGPSSLRQAVGGVAPGGEITFDMDDGVTTVGDNYVIVLSSTINVNRSMTIDGPNVDDTPIVVNGNGAARAFTIGFGISGPINVTINDLTVINGKDPNSGGGIYLATGHTLTLDRVAVMDSEASQGGGIYSEGTLNIYNSTIAGNTATGAGGGGGIRVHGAAGEMHLVNVTVANNISSTYAGIYFSGETTSQIVNSTIAGNSPDLPGDGLYAEFDSGYVSVRQTIIDDNCTGFTFNAGGNFSRSGSGCPGATSDDLDLGPLTDNGGPTLTILPGPNSPAIGALQADACDGINDPDVDQRGFARPQGERCDAGAVEVRFASITGTDATREATQADGWQADYSDIEALDWDGEEIDFSCTPAEDTWLGLGDHNVICTTENTTGDYNQSTAFTITVEIPDAPTMEQPGNITRTSASPSGLVVEFDDPEAEDFNGDPLDVTCEPLSGTLFPLGTTPVTCTSEADDFGRTVARTFTVTIQPAQSLAPTFSATPGSVIPTTNPDGTAVTFAPNVSSQIDENPTVVCTPPSGTFFSIGTHTITCTVTDKYGLSSSMSFQLTIVFDDGSSPTPPTPPTPPVDPEPEEPGEPTEPEEPQEPEEPGVPDTSAFDDVWARTDLPVANGDVSRTWVWGPAPFSTLQEVPTELWEDYAESPDGKRLVRYYDKARMEITDPNAPDSDWFVTNGLLVVELITGQMQVGDNEFIERTPADVVIAGDLDDPQSPTYADLAGLLEPVESRVGETISERLNGEGSPGWDVSYVYFDDVTGHNIAAPFWEFMNSSGLVWVDDMLTEDLLFENPFYGTGRPVTEASWVTVNVGGTPHDVLLQCFERRCLTYTPENPDGWQVEAGNVGLHYFIWRYGE